MESSLHRELKRHYSGDDGTVETRIGPYRIDVVTASELIEIQQAGLGAIRAKVRRLLEHHRVRVVRPLVHRKWIVKVDRQGRSASKRRLSPRRGQIVDLFEDWIHFTDVFPHPRLIVEVVLVDIEEWRKPARRRHWRRRDYEVTDRRLVARNDSFELRSPADLARLVPHRESLPSPFETLDVARTLDIDRWRAQQIAYCLRRCAAAEVVGKRGNALQYVFATGSL